MGIPYRLCIFKHWPDHTSVAVTFHSAWTVAQVSVNKGIDLVSYIGDCSDMVIEGKLVVDGDP